VKVTKIIVDRFTLLPVILGSRQITFGSLITKLLEFERNVYWCMGSRLKCHTGRYGPQRP